MKKKDKRKRRIKVKKDKPQYFQYFIFGVGEDIKGNFKREIE